MSDREIGLAVRLPEGFEPSQEDVALFGREVWYSMAECLDEILLRGEPKRPLLSEGSSLRPGDKNGCLLADSGARAVVRRVEVASNG